VLVLGGTSQIAVAIVAALNLVVPGPGNTFTAVVTPR